MKLFKDVHEAREWFRKYRPLKEGEFDYDTEGYHCFNDVEMGDWLLFNHIREYKTISRPILGLVAGHNIWDQALVLEIVEPRRAFHHNSTINEDYETPISLVDQDVQYFIFWDDDIRVIGHWKFKPKVKELRSVFLIFERKNKLKNL
jgi:hypothetical protein